MSRPRVYTKLSPYQERILSLLYEPISMKEICIQLHKPHWSIHNAAKVIYRKAGISTNTRFARVAIMGNRIKELELQLRNTNT